VRDRRLELFFEAKLDNFTHALHEGIQFFRLSVAAPKGGNRCDVITVLVLFDQDSEFSFWLHRNSLLWGVYHERQWE